VLHDNRELFEQVILRASDFLGIEAGIIEKDYYVTLFLKDIVEKQPDIIFKGGTSLSKCYKLISRFSEDIDLNIESDKRTTEGQRKQLKRNILSVVDDLELELLNPDEVRSRREFNRYVIKYPVTIETGYLKPQLIVETAVYIRSYPNCNMKASSLVYDYLAECGYLDLIESYNLSPFEIRVQSAERTFIDKLYALGDYYLSGAIAEHSRHIYDVYKLSKVIDFDENLKILAQSVAIERKPHKNCHSAKDDVHMQNLLREIVEKKVYKEDYETITKALLFEDVSYEMAVQTISEIVDRELFS